MTLAFLKALSEGGSARRKGRGGEGSEVAPLLLVPGGIQEAALRPLLLPRFGARATEVRAPGLEHSVRVQRDGPADQRPAAAHVPEPV